MAKFKVKCVGCGIKQKMECLNCKKKKFTLETNDFSDDIHLRCVNCKHKNEFFICQRRSLFGAGCSTMTKLKDNRSHFIQK